MLTRPRKTPTHKVLALLRVRGKLSELEEARLYRLEKGHEGERHFAEMLSEALHQSYITLYGIMLEHNDSLFQIDSMIISQGTIYLLDIKYYSQEYYYHHNDFYSIKNKEKIDNPLHQLERCEALLQKLLKKHNFHYKIESHVVFIHPEYTLFSAPINQKILLRSQLPRFIRRLNRTPVHITAAELRLRDFIFQRHQEKTIYDDAQFPDLDHIKKGILCLNCAAEMKSHRENGRSGAKLQCSKCGKTELAESAVLRTTIEFHTLFPDEMITTTAIRAWCNNLISIKVIRRTLNKYLLKQGINTQMQYYFDKNRTELRA